MGTGKSTQAYKFISTLNTPVLFIDEYQKHTDFDLEYFFIRNKSTHIILVSQMKNLFPDFIFNKPRTEISCFFDCSCINTPYKTKVRNF